MTTADMIRDPGYAAEMRVLSDMARACVRACDALRHYTVDTTDALHAAYYAAVSAFWSRVSTAASERHYRYYIGQVDGCPCRVAPNKTCY